MRRLAAVTLGGVAFVGLTTGPAPAAAPATVPHTAVTAPATVPGPLPGTMPRVTHRGLVDALAALNYNTKVKSVDVSGRDRLVLWPAHWKVCSQSPAPGRAVEGREVTLYVVKKRERCP